MKVGWLSTVLLFIAAVSFAQKRRIIVAQDGSGNYKTVQEAFNAVSAHNRKPVEIFVKKGVYTEPLILAAGKDFVTLIGEDQHGTVLTYNNHTGTVTHTGEVINTYTSASFFIYANHFKAKNITFQNDAGFSAGQAVAVFAYGDELSFFNCNFKGFQDVLFCSGEGSRQYYQNCYIEGTTDFIFGPSTVVFQSCEIHSKKNSHVTAASTPADVPFGFVFFDCKLTADTGLNHISLGRPWRPYASVTYIRCWLGPHIFAEGWDNWKNPANEKTARFAEYRSSGPGANPRGRFPWTHQLTDEQVKTYTIENILGGKNKWNPLKD